MTLKKILVKLMIPALLALSVITAYADNFPVSVCERYGDKNLMYWKIRQITISPVFDEPETTDVQFYFEKPHDLFIDTRAQQVYARADTIWTYLVKHNQIQKRCSGYILNPFDFIDSAQTFYIIVSTQKNKITMKSIDELMEPDSLEIRHEKDGGITRIEYLDVNNNLVIFEILDESFKKHIPENNFLAKPPEGVEIIDIDE
jgi:outer membrane lipoprotein-sorting protein